MSVVANVAINVDSSGAVSKLRQVQQGAQATQRAFGALQSAIAGIGIASIAAQTLKAAASFNDLQTRLKLLTSEYGEYTQAQQFAAKAAKQFGLSNREAATGVADIYGRLRPLGVSLKDIQSTFNGFNTIARLSGVSAEGASAAFLQLGQALGSGRLQGDEFRSIAEQVPGLLVAVSKETGIAAKDLKQFASDGKLSADIVINALKRIESEGAGKIAALVQNSDTQKFKDLQNAVDDLSVAVGNELLPVVTPLIKDLTSLVGTIAALPDPVKNATGEIVKLIIQLVLVEKAIKAIIGLNAAFVAAQVTMAGATATTGAAATTSAGAFALYTNNAKALQATSVAATASVAGLLGTIKPLLAIGAIVITIDLIVKGIGDVIAATKEINRLRGIRAAGGAAAQFAGASRETVVGAQKNQKNILAGIRRSQKANQLNAGQKFAQTLLGGLSPLVGLPDVGQQMQRSQLYKEQAAFSQGVLGLDPSKFKPSTPTTKPDLTQDPPPGVTPIGGKGSNKAADDAKQVAEQIRTSKLQLTLAQDIFAIEGRLQEAQLAGNDQLVLARNAQKELAQIASQRADVITNKEMPALAKKNALDRLAVEAATVSRKLGFDLVKSEQDRTKSFGEIIADLEFELKLKLATTEQMREQLRIENELRKLKGQGFTPQQINAIAQKKGELAKPQTDAEKVQARINALQTEITQLTNIGNIAIKVADGIGAAFGQAFEGLITGSMTAQEALGNFFKSIGSMFIQMATEIIAKQMVMVTLGFIMKALGLVGSISSAGNAAGAAAFSPGNAASLDAIPGQAFSLPKLAANGAIFSNGIAKFASGGIVGSPTLFPFANGGAMQMGLMGEAGPEAIMPLQRGADGSLGVRAAMGGNGMGGSSSPILNMSFETSTINGVEYVSRDQLEAAMAQTRRQASSDGAKRGMAMTLDRIQQSPQTRRRIGM